jgi:hypothetical protein
MYALIEVDGQKVTMTSRLNDGRIVDSCVIDKQKDVILPYSVAPIFNRTRMMFKGMDLGICQVTTPPVERDGIWFAPFAVLVGYIGGYVQKTKGKVYLEVMIALRNSPRAAILLLRIWAKSSFRRGFRGESGQFISQ